MTNMYNIYLPTNGLIIVSAWWEANPTVLFFRSETTCVFLQIFEHF